MARGKSSGFRWTNRAELDAAAARAVLIAALTVERKAKELCPRMTGNLANSIHTEGPHKSGGEVYATVGTSVEYAPYVEFGTRFMHARPYLGPAVEFARKRYGA